MGVRIPSLINNEIGSLFMSMDHRISIILKENLCIKQFLFVARYLGRYLYLYPKRNPILIHPHLA